MTDHFREAVSHAWMYVREVVEDALVAVREAVEDYGEDKDEALHSHADGCEATIYTGRAWAYCLGTDNDRAYLDETGEEPPCIEVRAMSALMADVREHPDWDGIGGVA